jgi:hypothetical protein
MVFAVTNTLRAPADALPLTLELERDVAWYERHREELAAKYGPGTSLAVVGEEVVDRDADASKLAIRLRKRYGRRSIFMPRVGSGTAPVKHLRSPRKLR